MGRFMAGRRPVFDAKLRFVVGRQPIFDAKLAVHGYELLYRDPICPRPGGDVMAADVLVHAGLDLGLGALVGDKPAFVNATREFLTGAYEVPFSPRQAVIEVPGGVPRDPEVLAGCRRLVLAGYTLALGGYAWGNGDDPLLGLVSIVKLDVPGLGLGQLAESARRCSAYGARLVAEKVETRGQLEACQELGFDLFQGYLLCRPEVVEGRSLSPTRLTCLRLLQKLCDPATSFAEVEHLVQTDAALSYRFLRAAGAGAAQGMFRRLRSVRDAVVMLGERRLRAWLALMLLAGAHEGSDEQLNIAMTRARMAEEMALSLFPEVIDRAFTVGLVSALDLFLQAPLPALVQGLALAPEIEGALLAHQGPLGAVLADVLAWEAGGEGLRPRSGLSFAELERCYLHALAWATEMCGVLDLTGG
jgi:EAL and modified HD-GYP domain-containing signal transduction protein